MVKHRKSWTVSVVMSFMLLITACGGGNNENNAGTSSSPSASASASATPQEPVNISFMSYYNTSAPPIDGPALGMIKDKFNATIKPEFVLNSDYNNKVSVVMASGSMPDVMVITTNDTNYYKWAKQGAFLQLDEYFDQYPSLKEVPDHVRNQLKVDGKSFGIPTHQPSYSFSGLIRQDWLDNLGLSMPTNYEELKAVALAFTNDDPDGNGQKDTYGFALSSALSPDYNMGAYWSTAWYHKNSEGQLIPGLISPGRQEVIKMLSESYAAGAVTKDFAVLNWQQTNNEFYSGKAGIFIGIPNGMSEPYYTGLLELNPEADLAPIPYFVAPDGSQGALEGKGWLSFVTLSAKLKDQPEKVAKILEILDYGRQWVPVEERTPDNERYDFLMGGNGVGYTVEDGKIVWKPVEDGVQPMLYMLQLNFGWKFNAPSNEANQFSKMNYTSPKMQNMIAGIEQMIVQNNKTPYNDPSLTVFSETNAQKGSELNKFLLDEQIKMVAGAKSLDDWDAMVQEYLKKGGEQIISEINQGLAGN